MTDAADLAPASRPIAGYVGLVLGAVALLMVLVHFWSGPFAPQQRTGVSIGEIAADIRASATRAITGAPQPAPQARPWTADRTLKTVTAVVAGLAVILGILGLVRRETWRPSAAAIVLAAGAITFQLFTWAILLIAGSLIIAAIIYNIGDILGQ
jgi:hypothetical protein